MIHNSSSHALVLLLLTAAIALTGCEQNQPNKNLPAQQSAVKKYEAATTLHGTVSDSKGYAENGTVNVSNVDGKIIASTTLQNSKNYSVEVPANTPLPVVLSFSPEQGEKMVSVVVHPSITKYDINPMTTAIAAKAATMGGYTDSNIRQAAETVSSMSDAGKATAGAQGNPTQRYGGWH